MATKSQGASTPSSRAAASKGASTPSQRAAVNKTTAAKPTSNTTTKTQTKTNTKTDTKTSDKKDTGIKFYPGTFTPLGKALDEIAENKEESSVRQPTRVPQYDSKGKLLGYIVTTYNADGSSTTTFEGAGAIDEGPSKETKDAYALLEEAFKLYGLDSLVPVIRGYMEQDLGPEQAKLKLRSEKAYKDRFKGNELRVAKGLNMVSEAEYLELENDYSETLRAYGLNDYFGISTDANTRLARQQKMAEVIGNDISAAEFKDRIDTVVTRVNMSDPNIKTELKRLYAITDTDLVKYFLNPVEGSEQLKQKVTAAEISGASITQGLGQTSLGTAEELAKLGIDRAEALAGYSKIAQYLPTTEKLSSIYASEGITYNKATGEEEEFKGLASAKRKRQTLAARELGTFSGSSGTSQSSLKTKTAGQI
jgi:hypothetical protein